MIHLARPEAFLAVPLVLLVLRARAWPRSLVGVLRMLVLLAAVTLLAQPSWRGADDGRDVVLVVDRSASMPADARAKVPELAGQIAAALQDGDRLGVVGFGRKPIVDAAPQAPFVWPTASRAIDQDASDLGAALAAALALLPPGRQGSLLVVSDGEHTSGDLGPVLRAARRQGVRIDAMHVAPTPGPDCAVVDVGAPATTRAGEPFVLSAVAVTERAGPARWRLLVDGEVVQHGDTTLVVGRNVLQFRHTLAEPGQHDVAVEVTRADDARPANDRAIAVVRAEAPARVLCVTPGGRDDRFTRALRGAGFTVVVAAPERAPLALNRLDGFRAVVLEDVPAAELPPGAMDALASWVTNLGGGLLMTGGRASFGVGGYHKTVVETVLPVTMEIREEQRRFGLAMAIALDCSGSMSADAGGTTKMVLANRGTGSAIELLSPIDAVAVLGVDDAPEIVVPMQTVADRAELVGRARSIAVGGGGIYVGPALHAAAAELAKAVQQHKHLVLFADAADAEQPGDYETFVPQLVRDGITVSVIGLGGTGDPDAALLQHIAQLGQGRCQFVGDATDLPRVFAQETIQVARSSVIEAVTAVSVRPAFASLGDVPASFPAVAGYAMAWPRERAEQALVTVDDQKAPLLAHWQVGLGRAAAFLGEVDGALAGELASWPEYASCFATLVRWLVGGQPQGLYTAARRDGGVGVFTLEVDAERARGLDGLRAVLTPPAGEATGLGFTTLAPGRLEARVPLLRTGTYRVAVKLGAETIALPPVSLPYSPEFALEADRRAGERALRGIVRATGGSMEPGVEAILAGERQSTGAIDLGPAVAWALVVLLLLEIVVRRLHLTLPLPRWLRRRAAAVRHAGDGAHVADGAVGAVGAATVAVAPAPGTSVTPAGPAPAPAPAAATASSPAKPKHDDGLLGALARAKKRSGGSS